MTDACEQRILSFADIGDDWDGEGAKGIPRSAVDDALYFWQNLRERCPDLKAPNSLPSRSGEIVLYWWLDGGGEYTEVNCESEGDFSMIWGNDILEWNRANTDWDRIVGILNTLKALADAG